MAAITITLPERQAARLTEMAKAEGLTLEGWFQKVAEQTTSIAHLQKTNPEEWRRRFKEFIASRKPDAPVLPDEAMSRESIHWDGS